MKKFEFTLSLVLRKIAAGFAGAIPVTILSVAFFNSTAIAQTSKIAQTEVRLEPSGDTGENDLFGGNVAISANGSTLVVSGQGADSAATPDTGAVFIFERVNNTWKQTDRLVASNAVFTDDFGNAIAVSEDGNLWLLAPTARVVLVTDPVRYTYSSV